MTNSITEADGTGESCVRRSVALLGIAIATAVTIVAGLGATNWVDQNFPGFLVLSNRVVASVGLPDWYGAYDTSPYQSRVETVSGAAVETSGEIYRRVSQLGAASLVTYEFRRGLSVTRFDLPTRIFGWSDYWMIFGAYLATAYLYLVLAFAGAAWSRDADVGRALFAVGTTGGIFALSAVGIYDPDGGLRLHALAEAFFPAALLHLTFVLPRRSRARFAGWSRALPWSLSAAIALPYQLTLYQPEAYAAMHSASEAYLGLAGFTMITYWTLGTEPRERREPLMRAALAASVLGLAVPALIMTISGLGGGTLPVNLCSLTAFLFPTCLLAGVVREMPSRSPAPTYAVATG